METNYNMSTVFTKKSFNFACIYKLTSPSGKIYIGQTQCLYKRFQDYRKPKANEYLMKAILKYGLENISVEIIDLRTVAPLDVETIIQSVEKTGRVVVVQEAQRQAGVAAQVVSEISERAILSLEAPIGRVSAPDTVFPFGQAENVWLPNAKDIEDKVKEIAEF